MNQKTYVALCALAVIGAATGADVKAPVLTGATDRDPLGYKAGETMSFTLAAKGGKSVRWTRTGDDGRTEKGEASADKPVVVKTSLDRPGFVRIVAELLDASGKAVASFDGGAGAEVDGIRPDNPAPEDFDAFWARHKAALAKVAMDGAICREVASGRSDVKLYEVSIPCAGPRPATGFLSVPAKPGKYPARIHFHGYAGGTKIPGDGPTVSRFPFPRTDTSSTARSPTTRRFALRAVRTDTTTPSIQCRIQTRSRRISAA